MSNLYNSFCKANKTINMSPLATVNEHYRVIIEKNIVEICDKYYPSEDTYVVLEGPRLTTTGYAKIAKGWGDFCQSNLELKSIEWTEGPYHETSEQMAWVSGIIRLEVAVGEKAFANIFRSSFVLVPHEGQWKIKHEHVSMAHADPYGIGDWLKNKA
jgi:ketosteroid isomerase-like protein